MFLFFFFKSPAQLILIGPLQDPVTWYCINYAHTEKDILAANEGAVTRFTFLHTSGAHCPADI